MIKIPVVEGIAAFRRILKTVLVFFPILFLSGCLSLTEGAGRLLEGRFNYTVRHYRSPKTVPQGRGYQVLERAGKAGRGLDILIEALPFITLKASLPEQNGSFYLKSLDYLGGNSSGWVEFSLALSGGGSFISREGGVSTLRLRPPTDAALISGGRIRREGTLLSGEEALRALNNRYERIQALTEWMRGKEAPLRAAGSLENFESYWKPLLLPELVPRKKRPPLYSAGTGLRRLRAEQVSWNTAYTEKILPEELRSLRDSGTLNRDWEESRGWIFLIYAWDHIFNTLETSAVELREK
ncbi:MAG: hypothetical protein LBG07_03080 [Treponema sp.]|jgi:hypothetical protein|nr:hypothetical protein [Treponema sp.]